MKHILKPVDAMKLRGRVTVTISVFLDAPEKEGGYTVTGTAIRPDWWPFAWPLVFEKTAPERYCIHDPVTGSIVTRAGGSSAKRAAENAGHLWRNRQGKFGMRPSFRIFCDWIERDDIRRGRS